MGLLDDSLENEHRRPKSLRDGVSLHGLRCAVGMARTATTRLGTSPASKAACSGVSETPPDEHVGVWESCGIARSADDSSCRFVEQVCFMEPNFVFPAEPGGF